MKSLKDKKVCECLICLLFLTVCHWVQFLRSGYVIQAEIRGICAAIALIVTLFTGRKYWSALLFLWAIAILYWNRFHNYTSFIMILIAIWISPKTKFIYLMIYSVGVLVCSIIYRDSFTHLVIHGIGCAFFYTIFAAVYHIIQYLNKVILFLHTENRKLRKENLELKKYKKEKLILTPDEETVIKELCAGKEVKEICVFSQNTVYVRLRQARERNGCINNDELIARYKNDLSIIPIS